MRKILLAFAMNFLICFSAFSLAITPGSYYGNSGLFDRRTDLVNGAILLQSKFLERWRFYGPITYHKFTTPDSCSFMDVGFDPMTQLLIELFPSAGAEFKASGTGSISRIDNNQDHLVEIIVSLFKIAEDVRKQTPNSQIFLKPNTEASNNVIFETYFRKTGASEKLYDRLIKVARVLAQAVRFQETTTASEGDFPEYFVNNLLEAYTWSIVNSDKLPMLAQRLREELGPDPAMTPETTHYESKLAKVFFGNASYSWAPFHAGQYVISNGNAVYTQGKRKYNFADCVETTVRQILACILSRLNENDQVVLDFERVKNCPAIRDFFAPEGNPKDIIALANDGSEETRAAWANVISGHKKEGVVYCHETRNKEGYELESGWDNIVRILCRLLDGYNAIPAVAETIQSVNEATEKGEFKPTKSDITRILKQLIRIREDVELRLDVDMDKDSEIYGRISIIPTGFALPMNFYSSSGHSYLKVPAQAIGVTADGENLSWIEHLYYKQEIPLKPEETRSYNFELSSSRYPFLEYLNRLGHRREEIALAVSNALKYGFYKIDRHSYDVSGAARLFARTQNTVPLYDLLKTFGETPAEGIRPMLVEICRFVLEKTEFNDFGEMKSENFFIALAFLNKYAPEIIAPKQEEYLAKIKSQDQHEKQIVEKYISREDVDLDDLEIVCKFSIDCPLLFKSKFNQLLEDFKTKVEYPENPEKTFRECSCFLETILKNNRIAPEWLEDCAIRLFDELHPDFGWNELKQTLFAQEDSAVFRLFSSVTLVWIYKNINRIIEKKEKEYIESYNSEHAKDEVDLEGFYDREDIMDMCALANDIHQYFPTVIKNKEEINNVVSVMSLIYNVKTNKKIEKIKSAGKAQSEIESQLLELEERKKRQIYSRLKHILHKLFYCVHKEKGSIQEDKFNYRFSPDDIPWLDNIYKAYSDEATARINGLTQEAGEAQARVNELLQEAGIEIAG